MNIADTKNTSNQTRPQIRSPQPAIRPAPAPKAAIPMPDSTPEERERCFARLEELGKEKVESLLAVDGFPHHWRLQALDWLSRGGQRPKEA